MKIKLTLITLIYSLFFINCSFDNNKAEAINKQNSQPNNQTEDLSRQITVTGPNGDTSPVKTMESRNGEFSFKSPCPSVSASVSMNGNETEITSESIVCSSNKVTLTVNSFKDDAAIIERLKEIEKDQTPIVSKENGYQILTFGNSRRITTNTKSPGFPDSVEISDKVSKNKIYKINKNWLIELSAECLSDEKDYCNEIFYDPNGNINVFFNSLKISK